MIDPAPNETTNKKIVAEFARVLGQADVDALLPLLADNLAWWVLGKPKLFAGAGTWSKAQMADRWLDLYSKLDGGLGMDVLSMTAEGDEVAAEFRAYATMTSGKRYENRYCIIFTVQHGKITAAREYVDLLHISEVFA
jgi:ketosteroid isomerase-like protein